MMHGQQNVIIEDGCKTEKCRIKLSVYFNVNINVLLNKYILNLLTKIKDFDNIYTFVLFRKFG